MGALESARRASSPAATPPTRSIAEIRALHYEMLAYHARGDLAGYFQLQPGDPPEDRRSASGNAVLAQHLPPAERATCGARATWRTCRSERWDAAVREHERDPRRARARATSRASRRLLLDHLAHKLASVLVLEARRHARRA